MGEHRPCRPCRRPDGGRLDRLAPAGGIPVAIERPSGLIVDALVEAGHPVVPIHPNVVKACRPRYRAAGGKSDPGDAFMLADILRTDGHRFRPLRPCSDDIKAPRALVRGRDDLVAERVVLANRLRSLRDSFWPGAADIDSSIALAFVQGDVLGDGGGGPQPDGSGSNSSTAAPAAMEAPAIRWGRKGHFSIPGTLAESRAAAKAGGGCFPIAKLSLLDKTNTQTREAGHVE